MPVAQGDEELTRALRERDATIESLRNEVASIETLRLRLSDMVSELGLAHSQVAQLTRERNELANQVRSGGAPAESNNELVRKLADTIARRQELEIALGEANRALAVAEAAVVAKTPERPKAKAMSAAATRGPTRYRRTVPVAERAMTSIVLHYKELSLKGKNRPWFVQVLIRNIKTALTGLNITSVRSVMGRIEIELGPKAQWDEVRERVSRVFGVANFSYAARAPHDFTSLAATILEAVGDRTPASFRVSVRGDPDTLAQAILRDGRLTPIDAGRLIYAFSP